LLFTSSREIGNNQSKGVKLSIITVNLNNCDGLRITIESVINQSFSDFEYIIIDGGSTDGSQELIKQYNTRINHWISEPDNGIYHAMNKGTRKADGEYLLFLNSGDWLIGNTVLDKVFESDFNEDIVVGDCNVSNKGEVVFKVSPPEKISLAAFYNKTIPHQAAFIKRGLFERFGYYSEKYRIHSDFEFFIRTLILQDCSYRHLPLTVTDYNLEGISGREEYRLASQSEYNTIINNQIPSRVVADYVAWENERNEMAVMYWVKSKKVLNKLLTLIYHSAVIYAATKKFFLKTILKRSATA
jgi:glycosyltransferase involved in cell wall biosynthesis